MHCTCRTLLSSVFAAPLVRATTTPPPVFLAPAIVATQISSFSTTSATFARKDGNKARGVSALRRTGLKKQKLSIKPEDLPKPVLDSARRSKVEVDEDHGLWEFFPSDRKSMATPEELLSHGRAWDIKELRHKDWDDLHRLWWVCVKERNRLATYKLERERVGNMYGRYESDKREKEIRVTMKRIKFVLTERWYTWENARQDAMQDAEINMYADLDAGEAAYLPAGHTDNSAQSGALAGASQTDLPPPSELPRADARP
ncbi:putative ribosomal protein L47 [Septoria linicola]|nr:putative ribosomal protein L47 [Septoria linicola]